MTLTGFIIGVLMMVVGFVCVRKTDLLLRYLGDISVLFGAMNASWLSWKIVGVILLLLGFMIAFGLFQAFFYLTLGPIFNFGGTF